MVGEAIGAVGSIFGTILQYYGMQQQIAESQRVQGIQQQNFQQEQGLNSAIGLGNLGVSQGNLALGQQQFGLSKDAQKFSQKFATKQFGAQQEDIQYKRGLEAKNTLMDIINGTQQYRNNILSTWSR